MALYKDLFASRAMAAFLRPAMRLWRALQLGGTVVRHDPALHRLLRSTEPAIFAMWHQDFLHTCGYLSRYTAHRPTRVLASASRDGGMMAAAAQAVGFAGAVRGSSAKGGSQALRALRRIAAARTESLLVVCDGPRPPARVLKPGVLHLAGASGLPLWLVRTSWRPAYVFRRSWARFVLPSLWTRCVVRADGPLHVPPDLPREALEALRVEVEQRLNRLAEAADAAVGVAPTWEPSAS